MRYRLMRFPNGKSKAVTFSYDDGCRQDIRLSQILNKYGIKCTFNLNSEWLGKNNTDWHLTKEEIKLVKNSVSCSILGELLDAAELTPI